MGSTFKDLVSTVNQWLTAVHYCLLYSTKDCLFVSSGEMVTFVFISAQDAHIHCSKSLWRPVFMHSLRQIHNFFPFLSFNSHFLYPAFIIKIPFNCFFSFFFLLKLSFVTASKSATSFHFWALAHASCTQFL